MDREICRAPRERSPNHPPDSQMADGGCFGGGPMVGDDGGDSAGRGDFTAAGEYLSALRNESCGGHFREEYQTPEGEALRDDTNYTYAAAWEYKGPDQEP